MKAGRKAPLAESPPWRPGDLGLDAVLCAVHREVSLLRVDGDNVEGRLLSAERPDHITEINRAAAAKATDV